MTGCCCQAQQVRLELVLCICAALQIHILYGHQVCCVRCCKTCYKQMLVRNITKLKTSNRISDSLLNIFIQILAHGTVHYATVCHTPHNPTLYICYCWNFKSHFNLDYQEDNNYSECPKVNILGISTSKPKVNRYLKMEATGFSKISVSLEFPSSYFKRKLLLRMGIRDLVVSIGTKTVRRSNADRRIRRLFSKTSR